MSFTDSQSLTGPGILFYITMEQQLTLAHVRFNALHYHQLLQEEEKTKVIITINAQFVVLARKNPGFKKILDENHTTIDGQLIYYLLKIKYPALNFVKIAGSEFVYKLLKLAYQKHYGIFLLGASQQSNAEAIRKCKQTYPGLDIRGYSPAYEPYPFSAQTEKTIRQQLKDASPKILLVGFGAPKQEYWLQDNKAFLEQSGIKWAIGCGGSIDFIAGSVKRAPRWCQVMCLEWLYRFMQEPKLFRLKRIFQSMEIFRYILIK